jgi:periplasmic divalent cation tolerance protein
MSETEYRFVYVTVGSRHEGLDIGKSLVESRLVACANVLPEWISSVYRWKGSVKQDEECVLVAKTHVALMDRVIEAVKKLHSYECPCVIALPISEGNPDYLAWIKDQLALP